MVNYINSWAKEIVIAIILGTIIEMILPEGNNKKYIKIIIGIYVLFVIIYPIITGINNKTINLNTIIETTYSSSGLINIEKDTTTSNIKLDTNKYIENTYIENIKDEITKRLFNKNYEVKNIDLLIETENEEQYGEINNINLIVSKIKEQSKNTLKQNEINKMVSINKIEEVNLNTKNDSNIKNENSNSMNITNDTENQLTEEEIKDLKNYLTDTYLISVDKIKINNK